MRLPTGKPAKLASRERGVGGEPASAGLEPPGGQGVRPVRDEAGYCDLRGYAAIGDGRTVALIGPDGRIDWLPLPNLDSVIPFAALLDAEGGGYLQLQPAGSFRAQRGYLDGTNVLATTFTTGQGRVRVTDSMNTGLAGQLPWTELGRRIEGLEGHVLMRAVARPGTCLGRASPWIQDTAHGVVLRLDGLTMAVRAAGESSVQWDEQAITIDYPTSPGSQAVFGLSPPSANLSSCPTQPTLTAGSTAPPKAGGGGVPPSVTPVSTPMRSVAAP